MAHLQRTGNKGKRFSWNPDLWHWARPGKQATLWLFKMKMSGSRIAKPRPRSQKNSSGGESGGLAVQQYGVRRRPRQ